MGPTSKPMISLNKNHSIKGNFTIINETITPELVDENDSDVNQKMFVVVRNTKSTSNNQDYQLSLGDIVKLGRIKFKIKQLNTPSQDENESLQFYP